MGDWIGKGKEEEEEKHQHHLMDNLNILNFIHGELNKIALISWISLQKPNLWFLVQD